MSTNVLADLRVIDDNNQPVWVKQVDGKIRVSSMPYGYDIAEGNVDGHSSWNKYAINDDIDSANEEDIWSVGGSYAWLAAETQLVVKSSSVEDDILTAAMAPGTGIHSIRIYYLDDNFTEKTTDVTLNGTAEVNLSVADVYRINRVRPLVVGTGLKAAGNIDVKLPAPATTIYTRISTGYTKGRQLVYTVPAGKTLYVHTWSGSIGGTTSPKYGKFIIRSTWDDISLARNAWLTAYAEKGQESGYFEASFLNPLRFPEGSDVIVSCKTLDDNCYVTSSLRGWTE